MGHHHRSTLKQKNKTFKKTKKSTGKTGISHKQTVSSRVDRKNTLRQLRVQKTVATQYNRKIVAIVPLCSDADTQQVKLQIDSSKLWAFALKRDLLEIIQGVQVADFVLFVLSSNNEVDAFGEQVMSCIKTMGVPTVVCCAQFLTQHPIKQQALIRGSLMYYMKHHFPTEEKMYCLDSEKELAQCMRYLTTHIPKGISWRDRHGYIVADGVEYKANGDDPEVCTLVLHGEVRGGCLSANRLLHIPSVGDFQIGRILAQHKENVLEVADPMHQETLQVENELDPLDAEQTWPTDMEIEEAQACVDRKEHEVEHVPFEAPASITRRVPKGTSAYQAAWILDQADEPDSEIIPNDESFPLLQDQNDSSEEEVEYEDIEMDNKSVKFDLLDEDEEKEQLQEYLDRQEENKTHREFPDEVDTPLNMAASVRFARYRGLKSVRSSPWDPYENLPEDYGRIFQFQNLRRSKKRALDSTREGVLPGTAVSIEILNFPVSAQSIIR